MKTMNGPLNPEHPFADCISRLKMFEAPESRKADAQALAKALQNQLELRCEQGLTVRGSQAETDERMVIARIRQLGVFALLDREVDVRLRAAEQLLKRITLTSI